MRAQYVLKFFLGLPLPLVTGGLNDFENTSGGTWSFQGFKSFNSSFVGSPEDANGELSK